MTKIIKTKNLDMQKAMNDLHNYLKNTHEDIQIHYTDKRILKKVESEILDSFGEQALESRRIRFIRYPK